MNTRTRHLIGWAGAAALTVLAAPAVQAQDPRLEARLPDAARAPVDAMIDSAVTAGLPTEPLVDRALEGAAKGAPAGLIVTAVRRLLGELGTARDAIGPEAGPGELTAAASALRAGATAADLETLRELRPAQPLTVAAAVLAELVAVGVPADTAVAAVLALAPAIGDGEYIAFRRNVERDIALGASPTTALGVRFQAAAEATGLDAGPLGPGAPNTPARRRRP